MADIRLVTDADLDQLVGLVEQYRHFYGQEPDARTRQFLADRLANAESVILVADDEGVLVGFTQCYPTYSTVSLSSIWLLNDLFVDPDHRGRSIANELVAAAERQARESGASRIWLRTAHTNAPAQALYEKRGWVHDQIFKRYDLLL